MIIKEEITAAEIIDHFACMLSNMTLRSPHKGSRADQTETLSYHYSGSSDALLNGIFVKRSQISYETLSQLIARFHEWNQPYILWLSDEIQPLLAEYLDKLGFQLHCSLTCIGGLLKPFPLAFNNNIQIKQVAKEFEYRVYIDILATAFNLAGQVQDDFKAMLSDYGRGESQFKHYLASINGEPAGVLSALYIDEAVGVYCGGSLPQFRGMGVCSELYNFLHSEAKSLGCSRHVSQSAIKTILKMSNKLGFKEYGQLLGYRL